MTRKYLTEHELDCDDHGFFSGWEIISEKELEEYKAKLEKYKSDFDDGFEFETFEWDSDISWDYKSLSKLLKSFKEIDEDFAAKVVKLLPKSKWARIEYIFNELEDQLSDWHSDEEE